jgi:LuxR family maltose regulon positive regulatory protein
LPADRTTTRTATHLILGISLLQADDLAGAHTHLQSAITLGQTSGNRHAALAAQGILGDLLSSQGRLHAAAALYRQGIAANLTRDGQPLPIAGDLYVGLGHVLYMWNDLPAAAEHLSQGLALGEQVANWWTTQSAAIILAWLRQVQGDGAGAHALLQHAEMVALANDDFVEVNQLLAQQARVSLAQGNLTAVAGWVAQAGLRSDATPVYGEERLYRMLARALIVLGKPGQARALVQRMQEAATAAGRTGSLISLLVLHALALHAEGSLTNATHELDRALRLAAPEGYVRVFVDEGNTIAALLQQMRRRVDSNIQAYIPKFRPK